MNKHIDHTVLKQTCLNSDISKICDEAVKYGFVAVCVPPNFVKMAKSKLAFSSVKIATVIGFPFGYSSISSKLSEINEAIDDGADELDVVANISAIKNGDWDTIQNEITVLVSAIKRRNKVVKIIIESGILEDKEIIKCCEIYGPAKIDFLKTSTGYADKGASLHAVRLFRKHLPENVQIKASGGIRDFLKAQEYIEAGATRIGTSSGVAIMLDSVTGSNKDAPIVVGKPKVEPNIVKILSAILVGLSLCQFAQSINK